MCSVVCVTEQNTGKMKGGQEMSGGGGGGMQLTDSTRWLTVERNSPVF